MPTEEKIDLAISAGRFPGFVAGEAVVADIGALLISGRMLALRGMLSVSGGVGRGSSLAVEEVGQDSFLGNSFPDQLGSDLAAMHDVGTVGEMKQFG